MPHPRRCLVVLVAVIGPLLLAGCSEAQPVATTLPSVTTPPASPDASAIPATAPLNPPEQVFGGDCDAAFDPAVITSVWGDGARLTAGGYPSPKSRAVEQLGGLVCTWSDSGHNARADLVILPVSAVAPREVGETFCYGPCRFGVETSGLWLSGVVSDATGDETGSRAIMNTVSDAFTSTAAAQPATGGVQPGAWSAASECEALSASAAIPAVLGAPSLIGFPGNGLAEVAEGRSAAITATGVTDCIWQGDANQDFTMTALPGGVWMESELRRAGSTTDASVTGASSAFFLTIGGSTTLEVFADGNWMELQALFTVDGLSHERLASAAGALVAAMPRG